jgi:hypothetical protein
MRPIRVAWLLAIAFVPALVLADTSTAPAQKKMLGQSMFEHMMEAVGDSSEQDSASPVKGQVTVWNRSGSESKSSGLKNFQGSTSAFRGMVSYAIVRAAGRDLVPDPKAPASDAHRSWAILNTYAFIDTPNHERLEQGFLALFGRPLVKKRIGAFVAYDPAALDAAFKAMYVKPTVTLGGVPASVVYQTLFKDNVAQKAEVIAAALSKKGFLPAKAKDYLKHVRDPKFDATTWQYDAVKDAGDPIASEARLVGTLVRRQADGTLPAMVKMLRAVLRDYDPETLKKLDAQLKVPSA